MPRIMVGSEGRTEHSLYYEDFGTGPAVVFVSGWPLTQTSWEAQVRAFVETGHRVVTFDRRGFGRSTRAWTGYDHDTLADDLYGLLEGLDITGASLVGFSSGCGEITRCLAAHGSSRVDAVVLAAPLVVAPGDELLADLLTAAHRHRVPLLDSVLTRFFSVDGACVLDEPTRRHHLHLAACASAKATTDSLAAWADSHRPADLAGTDVPALIVHGACDAFMPYEVSGAVVAGALADSRTVLVPQAPHGAHLTHPHQWNEAVLGFLRA
ncbi:alpha/beta fold hydrolase [Streptomyces sp. NPDC056568]|uniref:alpha/beta fold hydrolase n=1 Tax=Streptomyces sp. NPDC056568 TaxID=3345866 RepID=UPI0036BC0E5A